MMATSIKYSFIISGKETNNFSLCNLEKLEIPYAWDLLAVEITPAWVVIELNIVFHFFIYAKYILR